MSDGALPAQALRAQLLRFLLVGGSAVAVDFVVYFALLWLFPSCPPSLAKTISFIAGAVLSFVLNRGFVFRAQGRVSAQLALFVVLYLTSLGLNTGTNSLALAAGVPKVFAWFAATAVSTITNFLGMKLVVFRSKSP